MSDNVLAVGLFWRNDLGCASVVPSEQTSSSYIILYVTHYRTFKPEWQKRIKEADKKVTLLREKAKAYYDQRAHPLGKLDIGRIVRGVH